MHPEYVRTEGDVLETVHICSMVKTGLSEHERIKYGKLFAASQELLDALEYLQTMPNDPRAHRAALDAIAKAKG